jgi:hypothetical protein
MIKLKTGIGKELKSIFMGIASLAPEIEMEFDDIGIKASSMATGNVAAIFFRILKLNFSEYTFEKDDKIIIRTGDLLDVLKLIKEEEILDLSTDKGNSRIYARIIGKKEKEFEIPLLLESNLPKPLGETIEGLELSLNTFTADFREALDAVKTIGKEKRVFFYNEKNILYLRKTDGARKAKAEVNPTKISEKIEASFNSEYLDKFLSSSGGCLITTIKYGNDKPLHIEFFEKDKFKIWFLLGPIVDNTRD